MEMNNLCSCLCVRSVVSLSLLPKKPHSLYILTSESGELVGEIRGEISEFVWHLLSSRRRRSAECRKANEQTATSEEVRPNEDRAAGMSQSGHMMTTSHID